MLYISSYISTWIKLKIFPSSLPKDEASDTIVKK